MIARVPVYGNLYLRVKESCKEFGLRSSQVLSALYFITGEDNRLCAAICTHVDDFLWTATSAGEPVVQRLLDRFKIGRIKSDTFRFCGREYVQSLDGTITINCRDNTRAIRPIDISKTEKGTTSVTKDQRPAHRAEISDWLPRMGSPCHSSRPRLQGERVAHALQSKAALEHGRVGSSDIL